MSENLYNLPALEIVVKLARIALGTSYAHHKILNNDDGTMSLEFENSEALAQFMHDHVNAGTRISKVTPLIDSILSFDVSADGIGRLITFNSGAISPAVLRETYMDITKEERAAIVLKDLKAA